MKIIVSLATLIQKGIVGDAVFPEIDKTKWLEVSREIRRQEAPEPLEYHFVEYRRNS